jgi:hypothetical protein
LGSLASKTQALAEVVAEQKTEEKVLVKAVAS